MVFWITGLAVIVVIFVGVYFYYYTRTQKLDNRIDEAWAQIDVVLEKRHDLIPNLVNTVKVYASHERDILKEVSKARDGLISGSRRDRIEADQQLEEALGRLFTAAENYPDLKASDNFQLLQEQLSNIEEQIASERQRYNNYVLYYNNLITTIPGTWFTAGRDKQESLEVEVEEEEEEEEEGKSKTSSGFD